MANVKISQLPALASLSGDDVLPVVNGNVTYKVTANAIADFVGGGGGANTGNVTFDNQIVIGTGDNFGGGGLYLAQGPDSIANLQYLRVRAGDYPTHIHLDTGNGEAFDQYFGDDGKYLKLQAGGNVSIGTDYTSNVWTFDTTGNMTVPGNIQSIPAAAFNSTITGIELGSTVIVIISSLVFGLGDSGQVTISGVVGTTEANGTWYFEATDTERFQLFTDDTFTTPVDGTTWTAYVSGGTAVSAGNYRALSITGGNVSIVNNAGNAWTFDTNGDLNIPGNIAVDSTTTVLVTNESGNPSGPGVATITTQTDANPAASAIQIGWTVTGNNLVGVTTVTDVTDLGGGLLEFTTDTAVTDPFWYNDEYTFTGVNSAAVWNLNGNGILTLPGEGVVRSNNDTIILQSYDVANSIGRGLRIGTSGQLFLEQGTDPAWLSIVPNVANTEITAAIGTGGAGGHNITIKAGEADQTDYYTTPGGNVNLVGGLGAFNDGGGGGPGGAVNLTSGASSDPAGHNGNVRINTGGANTWTFDYTGNLTLPGNTFAVNYANGIPLTFDAISNGTSNVSIPTADGPILMYDGGIQVANITSSQIAIGANAAAVSQGTNAIAIGQLSGNNNQNANSVAIGWNAGTGFQAGNSVAIGVQAGSLNQGVSAVSLGGYAGNTNQANGAIAIGGNAAASNQGVEAIAIGLLAGNGFQGNTSIAIGSSAAISNQGIAAVAIGVGAGSSSQGNAAIAIGKNAGSSSQGANSIAIGSLAGNSIQIEGSITLNASGVDLPAAGNGLYINPVRNDTANVGQVVTYNTTTKELTYANTISLAGNITGGNLVTSGVINATGSANLSNVTINSLISVPQLWFKGTLSADQSLTTSADTIILWNTNTDPQSWGTSTSTNGRIVPNKAGWYEVISRVEFGAIAGNVSAQVNHQILVNGAQQAISQNPNTAVVGSGVAVVATAFVQLNGTTDYITASCYTTIAGQQCVGANSSTLIVKWISS